MCFSILICILILIDAYGTVKEVKIKLFVGKNG